MPSAFLMPAAGRERRDGRDQAAEAPQTLKP